MQPLPVGSRRRRGRGATAGPTTNIGSLFSLDWRKSGHLRPPLCVPLKQDKPPNKETRYVMLEGPDLGVFKKSDQA